MQEKDNKSLLRVAAYCRVSTSSTEQLESLIAQQQHFEKIIKSNSDWKLVEIYSDIGSGLTTKNRPGYMKMIRDGNKHRFDLLLVKSLGRLGRDTLISYLLLLKKKAERKVKTSSSESGSVCKAERLS